MRVKMTQPQKAGGGKPKKGQESGGQRQLVQLVICVTLFLSVFIGKGAFPEGVARVGPQLLGVIRSNTDFRAAFASLGGAMVDSEVLPNEWKDFCVEVFGIQRADAGQPIVTGEEVAQVLQPEPILQEEPICTESVETQEPLPQYRVGDVLEVVAVEDHTLPEEYTYNHLYLGEMETANPVEGKLTSAFGYREHPTIGRYAVHGGVDIGAAAGSPVMAFADGTVEYVGENDDFGLYLRLNHENGVSTFYSHCQSIQAVKGQSVQAGQPIALVGSTGKSTGPHLHFEVQLGQVRLDPMHYITLKEP